MSLELGLVFPRQARARFERAVLLHDLIDQERVRVGSLDRMAVAVGPGVHFQHAAVEHARFSDLECKQVRPRLRAESRQRLVAIRYVQVKNDESPLKDGK